MDLTLSRYVYMVSNKSSMILFESKELAEKYLSQFSASIAGGMTISTIQVFMTEELKPCA